MYQYQGNEYTDAMTAGVGADQGAQGKKQW